MKKLDQNITIAEVLRVFKQKSKVMKGSKHHSLINKIALVGTWMLAIICKPPIGRRSSELYGGQHLRVSGAVVYWYFR